MKHRALIAISDNEVAPRLDYCVEVVIYDLDAEGRIEDERTYILEEPSADEVCALILGERVQAVICGGISEEHFQFLSWKKVAVLDGVIGPLGEVLARLRAGELQAGDIVGRRDAEMALKRSRE